MEQVANEDTRFPYHSEPPPSDIRRLYKKGHQFCSPSEPKKARKKKRGLRRHGDNINVDALSLNLNDHSGPFLTEPDEVLPPSEINKLERAYRTNPSSLPPEIRHKMDEGRRKNLESLYGRKPDKSRWKPTVYNREEFDEILWGPKHRHSLGRNMREIYAVKGNRVVNLVYDTKDNSCVFREHMVLPRAKIEELHDDLEGNSGIYDYLTLLSLFQSQEHYDIARKLTDENYIPKVKVVVGAVPYHPKNGKRNY
jgi:hypothetical protein